jgi:hypothetical protein
MRSWRYAPCAKEKRVSSQWGLGRTPKILRAGHRRIGDGGVTGVKHLIRCIWIFPPLRTHRPDFPRVDAMPRGKGSPGPPNPDSCSWLVEICV